ncbi:hypothetical protein PGT21_015147 [Puccinia graminis f. sp. tritici]|uniref:Uncharacterized protein n=1 Tax=Puccinia graminis f. sp. tritici TaxID=56615 RepID=A0A5B0QAH0_PUCGR|nr:hypothetical protein PGT21_015147 [Puccinia graminis f. sp. tritici]
MNTKDFNPRAPHIHKLDLVKFLKGLDNTIHLPSSINKQGLIKVVDQKLGRATDCVLRQRSNSPALPVIPGTIDPNTNPQKPPSTQPVLKNAESAAAVGSLHYWDPKDDNKYKTSLSGSLPDCLFECNDKLDEWSLVDASRASSDSGTSSTPLINDQVPEICLDLPGALPVDPVDEYPPVQLLPGKLYL